MFSGKKIYNFAFVALCGALQTPFHGRGREGKRQMPGYPFRLAASRQATFPKGTAFGGGGKVSGITQRRPLGGAAERSEAEGVHSPQASSPSQSPAVTALPKGEPLAKPVTLCGLPRPLPLGEVDLRSKDGEGEDTNRSAALSQKAALHLPFSSTTPPVKMGFRNARRRF